MIQIPKAKDFNMVVQGNGTVRYVTTFTINDKKHGKTYTVTDLNISCIRTVKGVDKETMVSIEAWGKMSEECQCLKVGDAIYIEGRFENKQWTNKSGEKMNKTVVVLEKIVKN
jgi:single-stranded DNA-binding protein